MLLNSLLELKDEESIFLAEESLQDLLDLPVTMHILEEGLDVVDYIEIQGFGSALRLLEPTDFWLVLTDRYCQNKIVLDQIKKWSTKKSKTVQVMISIFSWLWQIIIPNRFQVSFFARAATLLVRLFI